MGKEVKVLFENVLQSASGATFTMNRRFYLPVFLLAVVGSPMGCNVPPLNSEDALPDFSLPDVNANSSRYQETVSPRDYLGQISAWYFGDAL